MRPTLGRGLLPPRVRPRSSTNERPAPAYTGGQLQPFPVPRDAFLFGMPTRLFRLFPHRLLLCSSFRLRLRRYSRVSPIEVCQRPLLFLKEPIPRAPRLRIVLTRASICPRGIQIPVRLETLCKTSLRNASSLHGPVIKGRPG